MGRNPLTTYYKPKQPSDEYNQQYAVFRANLFDHAIIGMFSSDVTTTVYKLTMANIQVKE